MCHHTGGGLVVGDDVAPPGLLVPVKRSVTLRKTVAYAIEEAARHGTDEDPVPVHFVFLATWRDEDPGTDAEKKGAQKLLERITLWANEDQSEFGAKSSVSVSTTTLGGEAYLFDPADYAKILATYASEHELDRVIVDPEYSLVGHTTLVQPLEYELTRTSLRVDEAPVERPTRRNRLTGRTSKGRFIALFGTSFLFYQLLGGFTNFIGPGVFDIVTGAITALVVALTLSNISFYREPTLASSPKRLARGLIYVPYLLFEIIKSNLIVAKVILDPRMPIDPRMTKVKMYVGSGLPLMTLANSITLTPGTVTVRANDQDLYVHSLLPAARDGLFDGDLEKWVRFVFYGRSAARFPSPRERGDTEVLQEPVATDGGHTETTDDAHTDTTEDEQ